MIGLVVDASLTAAWCFDDEETEYARSILGAAQDIDFLAPTIWPIEMANVLLSNERRKRITPRDTLHALTLFKQLDIKIDDSRNLQRFGATLELARTHALTAYDASYLELALRRRLPIATLDNRLRAAALAAGVPLHA